MQQEKFIISHGLILQFYMKCNTFSSCSGSPEDEPEEVPCVESPPPNAQQELTTDAQQRASSPHPLSLDDLDVTPEKEGLILGSVEPPEFCSNAKENIIFCRVLTFVGKSSTSEGLDESSIVSDGNVPEITCLPDRVNITN